MADLLTEENASRPGGSAPERAEEAPRRRWPDLTVSGVTLAVAGLVQALPPLKGGGPGMLVLMTFGAAAVVSVFVAEQCLKKRGWAMVAGGAVLAVLVLAGGDEPAGVGGDEPPAHPTSEQESATTAPITTPTTGTPGGGVTTTTASTTPTTGPPATAQPTTTTAVPTPPPGSGAVGGAPILSGDGWTVRPTTVSGRRYGDALVSDPVVDCPAGGVRERTIELQLGARFSVLDAYFGVEAETATTAPGHAVQVEVRGGDGTPVSSGRRDAAEPTNQQLDVRGLDTLVITVTAIPANDASCIAVSAALGAPTFR